MEHQPIPGLGDDCPSGWGTFYPIGPGFGPSNFDEEMLLNSRADPDKTANNPHGPLSHREPPAAEPQPPPKTEDSQQPTAT